MTQLEIKTNSNQVVADRSDEDKVIPWAEGNGLWHAIDEVISGVAGADLVTFFVQNPYTSDSAESVGVRIGYQMSQIEPILASLTNVGLLVMIDLGDLCIYQLTDDPHRRQTLQQYVSWLQEGYHWARMAMDQ